MVCRMKTNMKKLINRLFKILAQLTALPNVFFAGHFICNHQAKMHFYCEHDALLKETLQQLDFVSEINVRMIPIGIPISISYWLLHWK